MILEKNASFCENLGNILLNNIRRTTLSHMKDPSNPVFCVYQWPTVHMQWRSMK